MKCSKCKVNSEKVRSNGEPLCWHCYLGERYYYLHPTGIADEIEVKEQKNDRD